MEPETKKDQQKKNLENLHELTARVLSAAGVCFAMGALAWIWIYFKFHKQLSSLSDFGAFGSYLQGAVGSLWALAGVLLIFVAFLAQRRQLIQQDAELEDQKVQFKLQHDSIKRQNFESTFFQLLNLQNQITSQMSEPPEPGNILTPPASYNGRGCFERWYKMWTALFRAGGLHDKEGDKVRFIQERYMDFYNKRQSDLGHYFRNLYHIFKMIKAADVEDKRRYTSLARAQLSAYELALLFYNGVSPEGEKFKPLIEEFGLLEHLDKRLLLRPAHESLYTPTAYK